MGPAALDVVESDFPLNAGPGRVQVNAVEALRCDGIPLVGDRAGQASVGGRKIYDAGDVQAHGFQIARHLEPGTFFSDTGNSAMGFAICAAFGLGLIEGGHYPTAIVGDGWFLMQAQAVRDMVKHGARCTVVVLESKPTLIVRKKLRAGQNQ